MQISRETLHVLLDSSVTKTASYAPAALDVHLDRFSELVCTWKIASAVHTDETYDLYLITGDGLSEWDIAHFPQVATTGAKTLTARIQAGLQPGNVTTAAPGVAAVDSATLSTAAIATNAPKSLAAGVVRHGPFGNYIRYELVVAGSAPSIVYSVQVQARG
jgi:hypothetical protein